MVVNIVKPTRRQQSVDMVLSEAYDTLTSFWYQPTGTSFWYQLASHTRPVSAAISIYRICYPAIGNITTTITNTNTNGNPEP